MVIKLMKPNKKSTCFIRIGKMLLKMKILLKFFASDILENYIINKRWYGGKASTLKYIEIVTFFQKITSNDNIYYGVLLEVNF